MKKWVVARNEIGAKESYFNSIDEAAEYFDNTIGSETRSKDQWCEMYDECVFEFEDSCSADCENPCSCTKCEAYFESEKAFHYSEYTKFSSNGIDVRDELNIYANING
jgi:hypothetical protein